LNFLSKMWCKWSLPAVNIFLFFINLFMFTARKSKIIKLKHHINFAGWIFKILKLYINKKDAIKPSIKLPPSPKKIFGNFNIEILNNNRIVEIKIKFCKKLLKFSLLKLRKYKKINPLIKRAKM